MTSDRPRLSKAAQEKLEAILSWYFTHYYGKLDGPGAIPFYCDKARVGAFATASEALAANDPGAIYRMATCLIMYQARKDQELMVAQRGMAPDQVALLTDESAINRVASAARCPHLRDRTALHSLCDLRTWESGTIECTWLFSEPCPAKDASQVLKRYGDFGKVPFSLASLPAAFGASDIADLHREARRVAPTPRARAQWLEAVFSQVWRVDKKIADFILSALSNPDLTPGIHPWRCGVDWRYFVVVDRHVMRALVDLGAPEAANYETYRAWLAAFARRTDLRRFTPHVHANNPRLIQQALYRFCSTLNREAAPSDCCHLAPRACRRCPMVLRRMCTFAPTSNR